MNYIYIYICITLYKTYQNSRSQGGASNYRGDLNLGLPGTTALWNWLGIGFYTPNFYFQEQKSKFDGMKAFTTSIFAAKK